MHVTKKYRDPALKYLLSRRNMKYVVKQKFNRGSSKYHMKAKGHIVLYRELVGRAFLLEGWKKTKGIYRDQPGPVSAPGLESEREM